LSYTGERKSSKKEIRHAQKLILMGMNAPSEVRDEIYFQIIKQLHKNPNKY
jgi:ribosomal protein L30E